jgi:hypothetical protein
VPEVGERLFKLGWTPVNPNELGIAELLPQDVAIGVHQTARGISELVALDEHAAGGWHTYSPGGIQYCCLCATKSVEDQVWGHENREC